MNDLRIANNLKLLRDGLKTLEPTPERLAALGYMENAYALLAPFRPIDLPELQAERDILVGVTQKGATPAQVERLALLQAQIAPLEAIKAKGRVQ